MTGPQVRLMLQAISSRNRAQAKAMERPQGKGRPLEFSKLEALPDEQLRLLGINVIRDGNA